MKEKWKELGIKDKIQYVMAVLLITSGIIIAFLSFFLNAFNIATGVLIYIGQCFITAGGIFGVSIYFRNKLGEFRSSAEDSVQKMIHKALNRMDDETGTEKDS